MEKRVFVVWKFNKIDQSLLDFCCCRRHCVKVKKYSSKKNSSLFGSFFSHHHLRCISFAFTFLFIISYPFAVCLYYLSVIEMQSEAKNKTKEWKIKGIIKYLFKEKRMMIFCCVFSVLGDLYMLQLAWKPIFSHPFLTDLIII